jgi:hypothetical protein
MEQNQDLPSHLQALTEQLQAAVRRLDPQSLSDVQAVAALKAVTRAGSVLDAARTTLAHRIERSNAWQRTAHRTAAHFIASEIGMAVG